MFCDEYFLLRRQNRRDLRALADGDREVLRGIARRLDDATWDSYEAQLVLRDLIDLAARAGQEGRPGEGRRNALPPLKNQSIRTVLALLAREAGGRMPSSSMRSTNRAALLKPMRKRRWSREMDMRPCSCTKATASAYRDSSSELPGPEAGAEDALAFSARDVHHSVKSTSYCGAHWRLQ